MTKARMVQLKWPRPWMYTNSELFDGLDLPGEQQDNFPLSNSERRNPLRYNLRSKTLNKTFDFRIIEIGETVHNM